MGARAAQRVSGDRRRPLGAVEGAVSRGRGGVSGGERWRPLGAIERAAARAEHETPIRKDWGFARSGLPWPKGRGSSRAQRGKRGLPASPPHGTRAENMRDCWI